MHKQLFQAVCEQLGSYSLRDTFSDVRTGGAAGGFSGFTYYSDTVEFFKVNRPAIIELLEETADDCGENSIFTLVKSFRCCDDSELTIASTLVGPLDAICTEVANCLAWFVLETAAQVAEDDDLLPPDEDDEDDDADDADEDEAE